jgi:hypothetical protein
VQAVLLQGAGLPIAGQPSLLSFAGLPSWARVTGGPSPGPHRANGPVYAAARRLAALPPATRRAWLAAHLAALRAGDLTLAQLP